MKTVKEIILALDEKGWYVPAPADESTPDGFIVTAARITQGVICYSVVRSKEEITEEVWERLGQEAYAKAFPYLAENDWQRLFSIPAPMPSPKPQVPPPPSPINHAPEVEIVVEAPPAKGGGEELPELSPEALAAIDKIRRTVINACKGDEKLASQYRQKKYAEYGVIAGDKNSRRKLTTADIKEIHSWAMKFDLEKERGMSTQAKTNVPDFDPNARKVIKSQSDHPFEDELVQLYSDAATSDAAEGAFNAIFTEEEWDIAVGKDEVKAEKVLARMQAYLANAQLQKTLGMNPAVN
jgi:hypothetical protein